MYNRKQIFTVAENESVWFCLGKHFFQVAQNFNWG